MRRSLGAVLLAGLVAACRATPGEFTLLFLGPFPAAAVHGLSWAPDPDNSRLVAFDGALTPIRAITGPDLAAPMAVAAIGDRLLVTERTGEGVLFDTAGHVVREWQSPFVAAVYASGGGTIVAARSPYYIPQFRAEPDTAPLIDVLDTLGRPLAGLATIHVPATAPLTQLANAGAVAVGSDGTIYFAPLIRDEIRKYGPGGDLRWTAKRGLLATETDPEYLPPRKGQVRVNSTLVNIALALGPDGRLYALGAADSAATALRLDVVDTATGRIVATRQLGTVPTAVAVNVRGQVRTEPAVALLAGSGERPREPFEPPFALPDLAGDTVTTARLAGTVTLVNFWASWCDPCREEFPHMAALYRDFARSDFDIAAISDDVDDGKMRAFVGEFRPPFKILAGGGRMKGTYHYRGLPYSVLLDRH